MIIHTFSSSKFGLGALYLGYICIQIMHWGPAAVLNVQGFSDLQG